MNITPFEMYWLTRLDGISTFFVTGASIAIGGLILGLILLPIFAIDFEDLVPILKQNIGKAFVVFSIFCCGAVFVPTTKEAAAIIVIPALVNSDITKEKVPEVLNGIFSLAEAWMKELEPKKEDK